MTTAIEPLQDAPTAQATLGGISRRTLYALTKSGELPHVKLESRIMYDPADLRRFIVAHKTGGSVDA